MGSASEGVPFEVSATAYPQHWEEEELGQSAYERTLPEMAAIPAAKIMTVNLNLTEVIATGLGVVPQVRAHRDGLAKSCADCRFDWVDGLEDSLLCLNYARSEYLTVTRPPRCPTAIWAEARLVRRVLMHDWRALAVRGVLDKSMLKGVQNGKGYLELGTDLTVLAHALRTYSESVGRAVPVEVERATVLAKAILAAGGRHNPKAEVVMRARDLQNRAFTVCMWRYNETRASIAYMRRFHGDVDRIIPSLYSARRARLGSSQRPVVSAQATVAPTESNPIRNATTSESVASIATLPAVPAPAARTLASEGSQTMQVGSDFKLEPALERDEAREREREHQRERQVARERLIAVGPFEEDPSPSPVRHGASTESQKQN